MYTAAIHFIWSGDEKLLPEYNALTVLEWANILKKTSSFPEYTPPEIWIWTDFYKIQLGNSFRSFDCVIREYNDLFKRVLARKSGFPSSYIPPVVSSRTNYLTKSHASSPRASKDFLPIRINDVRSLGVLSAAANYEYLGIEPNFGASSDLIRYAILYKYGGFYADFDVGPGPDSSKIWKILEKANQSNCHLLALDHMPDTSGRTWINVSNVSDIKDSVSNDIILSTKNNPILGEILSQAESHYTIIEQKDDTIRRKVRFVYGNREFLKRSIFHTGPGCVQHVLNHLLQAEVEKVENGLWRFHFNSSFPQLSLLNTPDFQITQRYSNTRAWAKEKNKSFAHFQNLINQLNEALYFEIRNLGCIRIDDYVSAFDRIFGANKKGHWYLRRNIRRKVMEIVRSALYKATSTRSTLIVDIGTKCDGFGLTIAEEFQNARVYFDLSSKYAKEFVCYGGYMLLCNEIYYNLEAWLTYCDDEIDYNIDLLADGLYRILAAVEDLEYRCNDKFYNTCSEEVAIYTIESVNKLVYVIEVFCNETCREKRFVCKWARQKFENGSFWSVPDVAFGERQARRTCRR